MSFVLKGVGFQICVTSPVSSVVESDCQPRSNLVWFPIPATSYHRDATEPPGFFCPAHSNTGSTDHEKVSGVCVAELSCLLVIGSSNAMAQQFYRGGSGLGISFSYGNGYNNFGGYNRGYSEPYFGGGYGGSGYTPRGQD